MKKKYLYNGQIYTIDQISDAAKSSGKSVNDYLALIKATPVEDSYDYNGKKYTPEQIHEAASASGKSFDEYLSSINVKKKNKLLRTGEAALKVVLQIHPNQHLHHLWGQKKITPA